MKQQPSFNRPQSRLFSSLLLFLCGLLFCRTITAQPTLGITAGPNYSYIYGDPSVSSGKGKPSASIDFIARIGHKLIFEPDLCLNYLRSSYVSNGKTHNLSFITLQLPLMIGYQFTIN